MTMSRAEAASALREVDQATARAVAMSGYRQASPHLILWGLIWAVGYALMRVVPTGQWGLIWLPLDALGIVGSAIVGARIRAARGAQDAGAPRLAPLVISFLSVALFIGCVYAVFSPVTTEPYLVFPALVIGLVYVVLGVWRMPRLAWIGAAVFALTMAGFIYLTPWLTLWMAAVGGGGLILGGLWLRKV
jgi:hypothetical protein